VCDPCHFSGLWLSSSSADLRMRTCALCDVSCVQACMWMSFSFPGARARALLLSLPPSFLSHSPLLPILLYFSWACFWSVLGIKMWTRTILSASFQFPLPKYSRKIGCGASLFLCHRLAKRITVSLHFCLLTLSRNSRFPSFTSALSGVGGLV
jgi:hypothetical protein